MIFIIRPEAVTDIDAIARYISDRNPTAALEFYEHIEATFDIIKTFPNGSPIVASTNIRLKGLRRIYVRQLKTYVAYYVHQPNRIEIVRVLHAARDRDAILRDEP